MSQFEKILFGINIALYGFLTIFSFAYVDLNLTLSQNPHFLAFVETMQQLGYFNRPAATLIYLLFIIFAFSFFIFNLWFFYKSKLNLRYLKISTITNTFILIFAYTFLSSDLFNYIFDAKIILNYHTIPYIHKPLDFPNDEWLRFMRWTHRYSPYGPLWLVASLIPAILGFGKFILNFLAFKIFIGVFHLVNTYLILKTLNKINPKVSLFGTASYALNPLFLIEGVANAHNDVFLAAFLLASIYFLIIKNQILSYGSLIMGTLIKYIPIINLPWFVWESFSKKRNFNRLIFLNLATMAIFTYLFSSYRITVPFVSSGATQVQFQPWYLFWTLPLVALLPKISLITISIALSLGASLRYLPFLFYGDWSHVGTIEFMQAITVIPVFIIIFIIFTKKLFLK